MIPDKSYVKCILLQVVERAPREHTNAHQICDQKGIIERCVKVWGPAARFGPIIQYKIAKAQNCPVDHFQVFSFVLKVI